MRYVASALGSFVVLVLMSTGVVRADDSEESIPLDKVPKPLVDAVKKRFPKGEMQKDASTEMKDGKTVFEVTVKENGKTIDVTGTPEGALLSIEKEIADKDLPKAVKDAVEKKYPKASYKLAEEFNEVKDGKEKLLYYEVQLELADKKRVEVEIEPDGKIKRTEDKTGKEP